MLFVVFYMHTNQKYPFMKKIFLFFCLFVFLKGQAQNVSTIRSQQSDPDGWVLLKDTSNIQFSVKEISCNGNSVFLVRIVNANTEAHTVNWSFWKTSESEPAAETFRTVSVDANAQVAGECPDPNTMTVFRPLNHYLYDGATINDLVFKLLIN
jgi:hypothetical protein